MLNSKPQFFEYTQILYERVARFCVSLYRLMGNLGGTRMSKRRLLMSTVNVIILYGAVIWVGA